MISRAQIKYIRSLRHKKYRQKFRQFIAEGEKIVEELLSANRLPVRALYGQLSCIEKMKLAGKLDDVAVAEVIPEETLAEISSLSTPGGILALCDMPGEESLAPEGKFSLMLEAIRDPGNLGTIIRIADWFAIECVICSPDCTDAFNPKTIQATMGSIARVKVVETDLPNWFDDHPGIPVYAATLSGESLKDFEKVTEGALLIGNESKGLSEKVLKRVTRQVSIPGRGGAESLNAAVATGILCSHLLA